MQIASRSRRNIYTLCIFISNIYILIDEALEVSLSQSAEELKVSLSLSKWWNIEGVLKHWSQSAEAGLDKFWNAQGLD